MRIEEIIKGISVEKVFGKLNIQITNIQYDSRLVTEGTLFICIKGFNFDGHKFIQNAIEKGARAFLVEDDIEIEGYTFVKVRNTRETMAKIASNFYNNPSDKLDIIGITGTNGKTSITTFISEILKNNNKVGLVGTIKVFDGKNEIKSNSTTPQSADLQRYFRNMIENGCKYCAMEVSSHSLVLNRVDYTNFKLGVFTNLTPDHLDFHKDLEDYRKAKEKLFYKTSLGNIINIDDDGGAKIYEDIKNLQISVYTYAIEKEADFRATNIKIDALGVKYRLTTPTYSEDIFVPVPGRFTVYNTLATIAACYVLNISKEVIIESLAKTGGVAGRFETVKNDKGINIIVDYAHTPDALENVLNTAREFAKGRIITIFGCGGDRDTTKRPLMASIAQRLSDKCIVTSDNPRTEDPQNIINDVIVGLDKTKENYEIIIDRKDAIFHGIKNAKQDDIVIIAGKGHENYQIIGNIKNHFDDKEVANEALNMI